MLYKKVIGFYIKGCLFGDGISCRNLGVMYANGLGVEQDYNKASEL